MSSIELRNLFGTNESEDTRHRVFISYHHENDEKYKEAFEKDFGDLFINESVSDGDYKPDLSDEYVKHLIAKNNVALSTVVVVLIGKDTYKRKHVDWEISAGLDEENKCRAGLVGILLPTYYTNQTPRGLDDGYENIPERLQDNIKTGYAKLYSWFEVITKDSDGKYKIQKIIDEAFERKYNYNIISTNNRKQMEENKE